MLYEVITVEKSFNSEYDKLINSITHSFEPDNLQFYQVFWECLSAILFMYFWKLNMTIRCIIAWVTKNKPQGSTGM